MVLLFGILSAVIHAQRTGEGQVIDSAITDGSAYISSLLRMMHNTGAVQDERGRDRLGINIFCMPPRRGGA